MAVTKLPPTLFDGETGGGAGITDGTKNEIIVADSGTDWTIAPAVKATFAPSTLTATVTALDSTVSGEIAALASTVDGKLGKTAESGSLTYSATTNLDMEAITGTLQTLTLTGGVTFTTSNRSNGRQVTIRITSGASDRALTFPAGWTFIGGTTPALLEADKIGLLSLTFYGTADADALVGWSTDDIGAYQPSSEILTNTTAAFTAELETDIAEVLSRPEYVAEANKFQVGDPDESGGLVGIEPGEALALIYDGLQISQGIASGDFDLVMSPVTTSYTRTLAANSTLNDVTNVNEYQAFFLEIVQDDTTPYTFEANATNFDIPSASLDNDLTLSSITRYWVVPVLTGKHIIRRITEVA